jgi:hypothetical protein
VPKNIEDVASDTANCRKSGEMPGKCLLGAETHGKHVWNLNGIWLECEWNMNILLESEWNLVGM